MLTHTTNTRPESGWIGLALRGIALVPILALVGTAIAVPLMGVRPAWAASDIEVTTTADPSSGTACPAVPGQPCSLRTAIVEANSLGGATSIQIPAGSYTVSPSLGSFQVGSNHGQSVAISGAGATSTIITPAAGCADSSQLVCGVFDLDPNQVGSISVTISGLTIQGAYSNGLGGPALTGGLFGGVATDDTTVQACTFNGGSARETGGGGGGAIRYGAGSLTVSASTFSGNLSVGSSGGAIDFQSPDSSPSSLKVLNSTFTNNFANATSGDGGGAIHVSGAAASYFITGSTFTGNTASNAPTASDGGGALAQDSGSLTVVSSTFLNNQVTGAGEGGAILSAGGSNSVSASRIVGNTTISHLGNAVAKTSGDTGAVSASQDWWGLSSGPGSADLTPGVAVPAWQVLAVQASPHVVLVGGQATVSVDLTRDNHAGDGVVTSNLPPMTATYRGQDGNVSAATGNLVNGAGSFTFTATTTGSGNVSAAVDTEVTFDLITINAIPVVTTQPLDANVVAPAVATFKVAASGTPAPTVQWQVSTDNGLSFSDVPGATSTTLGVATSQGVSGNRYQALFTNSAGQVTSRSALLTVGVVPVINTQPSDLTVPTGATASFVAGADGEPTPSVRWQVSTDGGSTFNDIPGATNPTYSFAATPAADGNQYQAVFTNAVGTVTSSVATLTVQYGPVVTASPLSQTLVAGATATFTAAAIGDPTPTVQWQVSSDGGATFTDLPGQTSATLTLTTSPSMSGNQYLAEFDSVLGMVDTVPATLTVQYGPLSVSSPISQTVIAGNTATFLAQATGNPPAMVQWQVSTDGGATFGDLPGQTSTSLALTTTSTMSGNQYRAVFSNSIGTVATSPAILTVQFGPQGITSPQSQTVVAGSNAVFTAGALANPALTVQWQVSTDGGSTFADLASQTSPTLSLLASPAMSGYEYRAVFTNALGTGQTAAATLTVRYAPQDIVAPVNQTVVAGALAHFKAAGSGNPAPMIQWQMSSDGGATFSYMPDQTSGTLSIATSPGLSGSQYRAVFTNAIGSVTTSAATLTVQFAPLIFAQPASQTVVGGSAVTFASSSQANPAATVQWQVSTDGGADFTDLSGQNSPTLSLVTASALSGNQYRAVFTNTIGSATSSSANLTVEVTPVVLLEPANQTVVVGLPVTFMTAAAGPNPPAVQWQFSGDGGRTFTDIAGAKSTTLNFVVGTSQDGFQYRAAFTNLAGSVVSNAAVLTVQGPPKVTGQPTDLTVEVGHTATFTETAVGNPAVSAVRWQVSQNGGETFVDVAGASGNSLSFTASVANSGNRYRAVISNAVGTTFTASVTLTVTKPDGGVAGASTTTFYFAEGFTGAGFQETLDLLIPNSGGSLAGPQSADIYYDLRGSQIHQSVSLTLGQVKAVDVNAAVGPNQEVSALVVLSAPGVAERQLAFTTGNWQGTTDLVGASLPAQEWDFAEGSTLSAFSEYLTLQNPNSTPASVTLSYYTDGGSHPVKRVTLAANSRTTIEVFHGDLADNGACDPAAGTCGVGPGIQGVSVSVTSDSPIVAERPMYVNGWNFGSGPVHGGHVAFGANGPSTSWNFAEGTTLNGFNEYLTLENPNQQMATLSLQYQLSSGGPVQRTVSVPPQSRITVQVWNPAQGPGPGIEGVSVQITSINGIPIVAERPTYMVHDFGSGPVAGATDLGGTTGQGLTFGFSVASTANGDWDYLAIQNTSITSSATVTITYYEVGKVVVRTVTVGPSQRHTVQMFDGSEGVGAGQQMLGVVVSSTQPILAEQPGYSTNGAGGATDTVGYRAPTGF